LSFLAHRESEICTMQTQQLGSHWGPALTSARAQRRMLVLTGFSDSGDNRQRRLRPLASAVTCWRAYCHKTTLCDGCREPGFEPEAGYRLPSTGLRV
jgi:hypothetical protein